MLRAMSMPSAAPTPDDRVALVTGASSGIGEACARRLARGGFRVVLAARRAERLDAIAKEIREEGGEAIPIAADLADADATSGVVADALDAYGRVDVLVNNAGFSPGAALEQVSRDEIKHIFDVNLFSALQLIGELGPVMRAQGGGRILNIGSLGGSVAAPLAIPYAATKAGLEAATRGLRLELAPWKIRLSLIIPGFVDTAVFDNARAGSAHLRDDPGNPYRQLFQDLDDFTKKNLKKALPPAAVADVVHLAATARRPKTRYFAPASARLQSGVMGLMPDRLVDRILIKLYKIDA
jgi:NAD(P)-dependent dehydrogenase (short-subunit alcohol dehydrogenase family)